MNEPLTIELDPTLAARLRAAAEVDGESVEAFARRVLADAVDLENLGDDEELARRIAAWRETGASAPAGDVHAWLRSLSTEMPLPRPVVRKPE
jgi:predicted transcriptional regulator